MKKYLKMTGMILALTLVLTLGAAALAETADPPAGDPPAADAVTSATQAADPALQEAMNALAAARSGSRQADLETELNAYVEAGKLTREQADLILKAYQDQESLRSGVCPNCGYQFSDSGKGGRMKNGFSSGFSGGKDGRGGFGGGKNSRGGSGRFGQQQNRPVQNTAPAPAESPDVSGT